MEQGSGVRVRRALVLGASGSFGGAVAQVLMGRGWKLRILARAGRRPLGLEWEAVEVVTGDALRPETVLAAAQGCDVIVHGVNPPQYRNWREWALPMLDNSIAAAREVDARLVFPANVYVYGLSAGAVVSETSERRPRSEKGRIRLEMENRIEHACDQGLRCLMVRSGDFFGPRASDNSWFFAAMVKPGTLIGSATYPGDPKVGHAWAYLPDLGETVALLLERERDLAGFDAFHFAGHWLDPGSRMTEAIATALGRRVPVRALPWWLLRLAAPVHSLSRELLEMRYLWQLPLRLDNQKLESFLGCEPRTPLVAAVQASLMEAGCH